MDVFIYLFIYLFIIFPFPLSDFQISGKAVLYFCLVYFSFRIV